MDGENGSTRHAGGDPNATMTVPRHYTLRRLAVQRTSWIRSSPTQHRVLEEIEWDVLVVLDACRLDSLRRVARWPIREVESPASATPDWLDVAETNGVLAGTRIVAANPHYRTHEFDLGEREVVDLSESEWDPEVGTVPPEPVLERADERRRATSDPVVCHLMQPHAPYLVRVDGTWVNYFASEYTAGWTSPRTVYATTLLASGTIDSEEARAAYEASVAAVWDAVRPYVGRWVGEGETVVVTSDHGEVFGELRNAGLYNHPSRCFLPELVTVPLMVFDRESSVGEPETPEQRLRRLGYRR